MSSEPQGNFKQIRVVTKYELFKYVRNKRIYLFAIIMALVLALNTIIPYLFGYELPDDPKTFITSYVSFVSLLIILGATLFSASALASEFEERTALLIFPRPIKKSSIFCGKLFASIIFTGGTVILYYIATCILSLIFTGSIYSAVLESLGMALLFVLAVTGVSFLISAIVKKGSTAAIMTFVVLFLILPMIYGMLFMFEVNPWYGLIFSSSAITNVIAGLVSGPLIFPDGTEIMQYYPEPATAAIVLCAWFIISTLIALVIFKRREF